MIQKFFEEKLPQVRRILKSHKVKRAHIFGSVCRPDFSNDSDIDFLISFKKIPLGEYAENYWSLEENLEHLLGHQIDIVVEKNIKNPYFLKSVDKTKIPIYE